MIIKEIAAILEDLAPLAYAEDFDNVGLLVGDPQIEVSGILVTLDTLETVVDEAIEKKYNLIVSFHPIIFKGLKKLNGSNYVERAVIKAIKHDIAIYSMHTALDNSKVGVNAKICEMLSLQHTEILLPKKGTLKKLTTYVPKEQLNVLKTALFDAGGGAIGNYSDCAFTVEGWGSYKAGNNANPFKGTTGKTHYENEVQLHMIFPRHREAQICEALFKAHPYEEVAYEINSLENSNQSMGMGMIGQLEKAIDDIEFLDYLKKNMNATALRHSTLLGKKVQKIAVLGGSGAFAISTAIKAGADVYITADVKYHQFFEAEEKLVIVDLGHYETEQFTKNLLVDYLTKKIPNFAVAKSERVTNPIKYY